MKPSQLSQYSGMSEESRCDFRQKNEILLFFKGTKSAMGLPASHPKDTTEFFPIDSSDRCVKMTAHVQLPRLVTRSFIPPTSIRLHSNGTDLLLLPCLERLWKITRNLNLKGKNTKNFLTPKQMFAQRMK
jgi:hypothetical protein